MKKITLLLFVFLGQLLSAQGEFITVWEVDPADPTITIPTEGSGYNYTVDWGDSTVTSGHTENATRTYQNITQVTTFTVTITGAFPRISFYDYGTQAATQDAPQLQEVQQWGGQVWDSMDKAFFGCENLAVSATDVPILSNVISMNSMFWGCKNLNADEINNWDVSKIEDMRGLFIGATNFNQDLNSWNVEKVTKMSSMFFNASTFNGNISTWNTSAVTDMNHMFFGANAFMGDISGWDVGAVTNMRSMFQSAINFNTDISGLNVNNVINMEAMFSGASKFNKDLSAWNSKVSNVTDMSWMFHGASDFNQNLGGWNITSVTDMEGMLDNTNLSVANYDNTLIGWAGQSVQSNITLGAAGLNFCNAFQEHADLIANENWTINDNGQDPLCIQRPFITEWEISTLNDNITIPTVGTSYNYQVDWSYDGITFNVESDNVLGNAISPPLSLGKHTVAIRGQFPRIFFAKSNDRDKIRKVKQWGDIKWSSMSGAFYGCGNFNIDSEIPDNPDLSMVSDMNHMFYFATFLDYNFGGWDISNITNMGHMLDSTGLSLQNYDNRIIGWATLDAGAGETQVPSNITLGARGLIYCWAYLEHDDLENNYSWTFNGDIRSYSCLPSPPPSNINANSDGEIIISKKLMLSLIHI